MRVVAGTAGGRKLKGPATTATRPMTDRTREAVFNSLNSMGVIEDATVVDLFAGTGALGIEALSRGAAAATFVDRDRKAVDVVKENLRTTGFDAQVHNADALSFIKSETHFDLAFVAPPYAFDEWATIYEHLKAGLAVLESDTTLEIPENWNKIKVRNYGKTQITMIEPA